MSAGLGLDRAGDGERERRAAELRRVNAKEEMVHDRIADEDRVENVGAVDLAFGADLIDQRIDRLAHSFGDRLLAAGVHHHIGDAAHQVFAEADLRVLHPRRRRDAAGQQRDEMHGNRR